MIVKQNAIDNVFLIDNSTINVQPVCKYLGVFVDNNLSFVSHKQYVTSRLSQHCGTMAKLRHFAPQSKLLENYKTNVNSHPTRSSDLRLYKIFNVGAYFNAPKENFEANLF